MKNAKKSKNAIFVVLGSCGEYCDAREWIVCWHSTQREADEYAKLAQKCYDELSIAHSSSSLDRDIKNQYDPHMQTDYTGTRYYVAEVPKAIWKAVKS